MPKFKEIQAQVKHNVITKVRVGRYDLNVSISNKNGIRITHKDNKKRYILSWTWKQITDKFDNWD